MRSFLAILSTVAAFGMAGALLTGCGGHDCKTHSDHAEGPKAPAVSAEACKAPCRK